MDIVCRAPNAFGTPQTNRPRTADPSRSASVVSAFAERLPTAAGELCSRSQRLNDRSTGIVLQTKERLACVPLIAFIRFEVNLLRADGIMAKDRVQNRVDHTTTDQTSVLLFIEDNCLGGQRIGQGSFDSIATPITQMFEFKNDGAGGNGGKLILDPKTGQPVHGGGGQ